MKRSIFKVYQLILFMLCGVATGYAQILISDEVAETTFLSNEYLNDEYPKRLFRPYINILAGFSTFSSDYYSEVGVTTDLQGGVEIANSMIVGTGISVVSIVNYEAAIVIPFEMGLRSKNKNFDITSSVGYMYMLYPYYTSQMEESVTGRTVGLDAYWRPTVSWKELRLVLAAGGMMYDFGNSAIRQCFRCELTTGPRYTFRLRAGIGF